MTIDILLLAVGLLTKVCRCLSVNGIALSAIPRHDRDINAAKNIKTAGLAGLVGGA